MTITVGLLLSPQYLQRSFHLVSIFDLNKTIPSKNCFAHHASTAASLKLYLQQSSLQILPLPYNTATNILFSITALVTASTISVSPTKKSLCILLFNLYVNRSYFINSENQNTIYSKRHNVLFSIS